VSFQPDPAHRIAEITLDEHSVLARSATVENERTAAISDLLKDNSFTPCSGLRGPFALHLAVEENRLRLEIRDRGPGLSREAESRAGRVFFSTKPAGEGNGIGLLLARATLERLGGQLSLQARSGGGVCTLLELPLRAVAPRRSSLISGRAQA